MPQSVSQSVSLAVSRIGCNPFENRGSAVPLTVSLAVSESVLSAVPQTARKAVGRPLGGSAENRWAAAGSSAESRWAAVGGSAESRWAAVGSSSESCLAAALKALGGEQAGDGWG